MCQDRIEEKSGERETTKNTNVLLSAFLKRNNEQVEVANVVPDHEILCLPYDFLYERVYCTCHAARMFSHRGRPAGVPRLINNPSSSPGERRMNQKKGRRAYDGIVRYHSKAMLGLESQSLYHNYFLCRRAKF